MLALLLMSMIAFFALYFAMLALLRRAAANGRALAAPTQERKSRPSLKLLNHTPPLEPQGLHETPTTRRDKHPDWRFLVRDGRRPFPSGQTIPSAHRPAVPTMNGRPRSDWAHYNKDLGDLNDPYQAPPSAARQA